MQTQVVIVTILCLALSSLASGAQALFPISDIENAPLAPGAEPTATNSNGVSTKSISISTGFNGTERTIPGNVRIYRNGFSSTCAGKVFPGTWPQINALYDAYTFYNNGPETCVTVNFDTGTCGTAAHATAYIGTFNPNNLGENYAGDVGGSITQPFSFIAPANSRVVVVVNSNYGRVICNYSFSSQELDEPPTPIPTLSEWAQIILALSLLGMAGWYWQGRLS